MALAGTSCVREDRPRRKRFNFAHAHCIFCANSERRERTFGFPDAGAAALFACAAEASSVLLHGAPLPPATVLAAIAGRSRIIINSPAKRNFAVTCIRTAEIERIFPRSSYDCRPRPCAWSDPARERWAAPMHWKTQVLREKRAVSVLEKPPSRRTGGRSQCAANNAFSSRTVQCLRALSHCGTDWIHSLSAEGP